MGANPREGTSPTVSMKETHGVPGLARTPDTGDCIIFHYTEARDWGLTQGVGGNTSDSHPRPLTPSRLPSCCPIGRAQHQTRAGSCFN